MLILASTSPTRKSLLERAGVPFQAIAPQADEKKLQEQLVHHPVGSLASKLAEAKSKSIAATYPNSIVIGVDQTLIIDGKILHKPTSQHQAKKQLLELRGKTHTLTSAICCSIGGEVIWQFEDQAYLTMRTFSDGFLKHYLDHIKEDILGSVGSYKIEAEGVQLFEKIEGDYFTILGFPLLPLLAFLRSRDIVIS